MSFIARSLPVDRLSCLDRLRDARVEKPVARAHAQALREALKDGVATKADLEALGTRLGTGITDLRTELKGDIAELRTEMSDMRASLKSDIQRRDAEIDIAARDLVIKGAGGLVVIAAVMTGLKLFG